MSVDKKTADSFTRYMKKFPKMYRTLATIVSKQLPKDSQSSVILDIGCGPGLLLKHLHEIIPHSLVLGIDISSEMIRLAHTLDHPSCSSRIFVSQASSEQLPFKDCSVDAIASRFSLTYWLHPELAFNEMYRILKSGGSLVLEALNGDFPRWKLQLIKYKMRWRAASDDVITYHLDAYTSAYTLDEIRTFITSAQFKIECVIGNTSQWKFIVIAKKM